MVSRLLMVGAGLVLLVGCGDGGGAASATPSGKASVAASAKPSAASSAAAATTATAAGSTSAASGEKRTFACDAAAAQNVCVEYVGKDHGDETKVKALCDDAKLKGALSTQPCVKEGVLGMCTTDAGGGTEANTYVYEKGAKTLTAADAKKAHCAVGDWTDLK